MIFVLKHLYTCVRSPYHLCLLNLQPICIQWRTLGVVWGVWYPPIFCQSVQKFYLIGNGNVSRNKLISSKSFWKVLLRLQPPPQSNLDVRPCMYHLGCTADFVDPIESIEETWRQFCFLFLFLDWHLHFAVSWIFVIVLHFYAVIAKFLAWVEVLMLSFSEFQPFCCLPKQFFKPHTPVLHFCTLSKITVRFPKHL